MTQLECGERVCRLITKFRWRKVIGTALGVANPDRVTACPGRSCRARAGADKATARLTCSALRSCESLLYVCTPVASCMPKDMQRQARSGVQTQALASAHKTTAAQVEIAILGLTPLPVRGDGENNYQGCPPMAMLIAVPARLVSTQHHEEHRNPLSKARTEMVINAKTGTDGHAHGS